MFFMLPVWLSGNMLVSINLVTLYQAQLVLGWVTIFGLVNHLSAEPGLLSLSHPSIGRHGEYPVKAGTLHDALARMHGLAV